LLLSRGVRPHGRKPNEFEQWTAMTYWPSAMQQYKYLGVWQEFEIEFEIQIVEGVQGGRGFKIERIFVVSIIIVGLILIFCCRGAGMK